MMIKAYLMNQYHQRLTPHVITGVNHMTIAISCLVSNIYHHCQTVQIRDPAPEALVEKSVVVPSEVADFVSHLRRITIILTNVLLASTRFVLFQPVL